jgi:hypothetical protein
VIQKLKYELYLKKEVSKAILHIKIKPSPIPYPYFSPRFESAVLVHNAGSLGPQGTLVKDSFDPDVMQKYFSTNLVSFIKMIILVFNTLTV